jgi:hypothetical protein
MGCSNTYYLGVDAALIGIGAAFWHVSNIAGITFIVSSVLATVAFFWRFTHLDEEKMPLQSDKSEEG